MMLNRIVEAEPVAVRAGDSLDMALEFFTDAAMTIPQDMTAWTLTAMWRADPASDPSIAFTVNVTQQTSGVIVLSMTPAQTRAMGGDGRWDVQGVNGARTVTFATGSTRWTEDVTR